MRDLGCLAVIALGLAAMASPAFAAGGADVVDDAAIEAPGTCHLESWVTLSSRQSGMANLGPGCTPRALPNVEIDGYVLHSWTRDTRDTEIGLGPKLVLRSETRGLGIGIEASVGYGIERHRLTSASVIVPLTIPVSSWLRTNFNVGWQWSGITHHNDLFLGAQAEITVRKQLQLMAEAFTLDRGKTGEQLGLRWTPGKGYVDIDLIGGHYIDGIARNAITLGVTLRR